MSKTLILVTLLAAAACGGGSKPAPTTPLPDDTAETRPAEPADPAQPSEPAEPPAPARAAIATAPPPVAAGAPKPHVAKALALAPATTQMVIGLDIVRLAGTPLGVKFREVISKSGDLPAECAKLTAAQFGNVTLTMGDGTIVATADGKLTEKVLVPCIKATMKADGKALKTKKIAGRTVHYGEGDDDAWVTWTKAGVPLLAGTEEAMKGALDPKAAKTKPELVAHANTADHARSAWAAGIVGADELAAMGAPPGLISGDVTLRGWLEITEAGTDLDVVLGFSTPDEAKRVDEQVRAMIEPMRGSPDVETLIGGLQLGAHGNELHVVLHLDNATSMQLLQGVN